MIAPKGTKDILPGEVHKWHYVEDKIKDICNRFGYRQLRTPVFEYTELFDRGIGDTTDVVQKEMYTFMDKGGRSITLRPEVTAAAVRAYLEHNLYAGPQPTKLYYEQSCYRYEKPQAGRLREFHQFGVEVFGSEEPCIDAEVISLVTVLLEELKISDIELNINSIGCPNCRKVYNQALTDYFNTRKDKLCGTCLERLEKNPLRILDCKSPVCHEIAKDAPVILDYICEECSSHFTALQEYLKGMGISYTINPYIVRGLDYYTKTVFEFVSTAIGSQGTVCGGGRYDGLVEELGGSPTPGVGFGLGLERLLMVLENQQNNALPEETVPLLFIASIGKEAEQTAQTIVYQLRKAGIYCEKDALARSVKAQMKYANKIGAKYAVVLGDDEVAEQCVTVKEMETGEQTEMALQELKGFLEQRKEG
ncbi:MAG: histidine--tRNA ligase [Ruminococcaceae bacterium]|nr:histidine--tRNA ligase [Oscillospiraceae bacterium]